MPRHLRSKDILASGLRTPISKGPFGKWLKVSSSFLPALNKGDVSAAVWIIEVV